MTEALCQSRYKSEYNVSVFNQNLEVFMGKL